MNQIALPFAWPVADRDEDFLLSAANRAAFEHLARWSLWPVMATLVTVVILLILDLDRPNSGFITTNQQAMQDAAAAIAAFPD